MTQVIAPLIFGNLVRKSWTVGQLDKLDTPLFFRLKYYYH